MMDMKVKDLEKKIVVFSNGVTVLNATPHAISFLDNGNVVNVESAFIVNATISEDVVANNTNYELVCTKFNADVETEALLKEIKATYPNVLIVGSLIAMNSYKGLIVGITPEKGYERVPANEKRMSICKFNIAR